MRTKSVPCTDRRSAWAMWGLLALLSLLAAVVHCAVVPDATHDVAYDPKRSLRLLYFSTAAYCHADEVRSWTCKPCRQVQLQPQH